MINRFSLKIMFLILWAKTQPQELRAEMLAMAKKTDLWPGMDIAKMPLAVFDGEKTWLFDHPKPPEGFTKISDGVFTMDGRHQAIARSDAAMLGGVATATLANETLFMSPANGATVGLLASFKAHRLKNHPDWTVDESVIFSYPDGSAGLIQARRMEYISLANALKADNADDRACWINSALFVRKGRAKAMTEADITFERMIELTDGLDLYLKHKLAGTKPDLNELATAPPNFYRDHVVAGGAGWAFLLDAVSKDWRNQLEQNNKLTLEDLMAKVVPKKEGCGFEKQERDQMFMAAKVDSTYMRRERAKKSQEFDQRAGWRVFVKTLSQPLNVKGYDATQVDMINPKTVLHKHYLKAESQSGGLELKNLEALSLSAGKKAISDGLSALQVFGFQSRPTVTEKNGEVNVKADGFSLSFKNADAAWDDKVLRVIIR